jgi:arginine-tRNA-protein transferase
MRTIDQGPYYQFFGTPPTPCPYLDGQMERKVVTELAGPDADLLYDALTEAGFRRSQSLVYKPTCEECDACVAVRVCVDRFRPGRSLNRVLSRNRRLRAFELPPLATLEHYELFRRYLEARHGDGGMTDMDFADYRAMVEDTPVDSSVIEYREADGRLYAVCLSDRLGDGFSLVYSFFEPDRSALSPGNFMVLWHIQRARLQRLPYVYLGYWIADCGKMAYKARFRPLEGLMPDGWEVLDPRRETRSNPTLTQ